MSLIAAIDNAIVTLESTISTLLVSMLDWADERLSNSTGFFDEANTDVDTHVDVIANSVANSVANTINT